MLCRCHLLKSVSSSLVQGPSSRLSKIGSSPCTTQRHLSSSSKASSATRSDSIFSASDSSWDQVVASIPPPGSSPSLKLTSSGVSSLSGSVLSTAKPRRQTMTAREISAFDDMFNMIFNAVSVENERQNLAVEEDDDPFSFEYKPKKQHRTHDGDEGSAWMAETAGTPSVGASRASLDGLVGKLLERTQRQRRTNVLNELIDRHKEAMNLCRTDVDLLQYAQREVFGTQLSAAQPSSPPPPTKTSPSAASSSPITTEKGGPTTTTTVISPTSSVPATTPKNAIDPRTYPHLIAHLMHTFRTKFRDPNLSLSIFEYARKRSIESYVYGCSKEAYNELIETRWNAFRDLRGVKEALEEMRVNGVMVDSRTRKVVESIRREIGEQKLSQERAGAAQASSSLAQQQEEQDGKVWQLLARIEELVGKASGGKSLNAVVAARVAQRTVSAKKAEDVKWDEWKGVPLEDSVDDEWGFDRWEKPPTTRRLRDDPPRRQPRPSPQRFGLMPN